MLLAVGASHSAFAQAIQVDRSLAKTHLPAQVRADIVASVARYFTGQSKEEPSGRAIAMDSSVEPIRLSRTGPPSLIVTGGSLDPNNGATGNADQWLFRRVGNHAVLILKGGGFSLGKRGTTYHNGMLDVQTAWNMSCCDGGIEVYRFDGVRYRPAYCMSYTLDEDNNFKEGPRGRCSE